MFYLILFLVVIIGTLLARAAWIRYQKNKEQEEYQAWKKSQQYTMLKVLVPKDNEKTPLAAEHFFAALHGILNESAKYQSQVSFEIVGINKFIHFYIRMPIYLKDFVESQLYAQYPEAEIKPAEDYAQFMEGKSVMSTELAVTKDSIYPFKTFTSFTVDPIAGITGALGNIRDDENLWMQCIVKPVSDDWQDFGVKYVKAIREGKSLEQPNALDKILKGFASLLVGIIKALTGAFSSSGGGESKSESSDKKEESSKLPAPQEAAMKAIEEKITKLGFEAKIRILATSSDEVTARGKIESLVGAFKQLNSTNMNGFKSGDLFVGEDAKNAYKEREFDNKGFTLNTEELASIFHLPSASVATPNIVWAGSKKGEPPADLPVEGRGDEDDITFFGTSDFRDFKYKFGIRQKDRRLHMYTIGKTGTGKSTLLENMIVDDIKDGKGVAIVDPHGQTVEHILSQIPEHRIKDVIYFNPADREMPLGFNLLEAVDPDLRSVAASGVVGIFKKLWADSWGPRLEYILRNAILALIEAPDANLLGINRLLVDRSYRQFVVSHLTDPVVKQYFETEYENYSPQFRTEAIAPIQNKVGQFLSAKTIRNIIGQGKSSFDVRRIMDERKIFLVNLSTGKIGEDTAALLGSMLITKIQLAAMSRADVDEKDRPDFYLYVDEFQNFATESFATILSEARKYHLNLVLTNQFIAQIPEIVKDAIFGNVGTIASFRVGPDDAKKLVTQFEPVFSANDLVNLDNYHIYTKLSVNGVTRPAFSAATLPPLSSDGRGFMDDVIEFSRNTYGRPEAEVEQEIIDFTQTGRPDHLKARDEKLKREGLGVFGKDGKEKKITEIKPINGQEKNSTKEDGGERYKKVESGKNQWFIGNEPQAKKPRKRRRKKGENSVDSDSGVQVQNKENQFQVKNREVGKSTEKANVNEDNKKPAPQPPKPAKVQKRPLLGPLLVMKDDTKGKAKPKVDFDELDRLFGKNNEF